MPSVLLVTTALMVSSAVSADTFSTTLGGPDLEVRGSGAAIGPDSSYSVIVFIRDWISFGDPWIVQLDPDGAVSWMARLGEGLRTSRELEAGGLVERLADGALLVSAQGEPRATGIDADACVMRVEPGAGMDWGVVIGRYDAEVYNINGLAAFDDGSFLVAGNVGCGEFHPFASLYDEDGYFLRSLDVDDSLYVVGADITRDGRMLLATFTMYEMRIHLLWFDRDGRLVDRASPFVDEGYPEDPGVFRVLASSTGRIYLCGNLGAEPWIGCLSADGSLVWDDEGTAPGRMADVEECRNGGIVCCGDTGGGNAAGSAFVARYGADGVETWAWIYEGGEYSDFEDVACAPAGGFVLAGSRDLSSVDALWTDAWVVKADSSGLAARDPGGSLPEDVVVFAPPTTFQSLTRPEEGWIVACGVFASAEEACLAATDAASATSLRSGALWIPDYQSLSGYEGWLAYLVPEGLDGPEWAHTGSLVLEACPDSYLVWIDGRDEQRRRPLFLE